MKNWKQWVAALGAAAMITGGPGAASLAVYAAEEMPLSIETASTEKENTALVTEEESTESVEVSTESDSKETGSDEEITSNHAGKTDVTEDTESEQGDDVIVDESSVRTEETEVLVDTESAPETEENSQIAELTETEETVEVESLDDRADDLESDEAIEIEVSDDGLNDIDNDALFSDYVDHVFSVENEDESTEHGVLRRSHLDSIQAKIYDGLAAEIKRIAAGERTSTEITVQLTASEYQSMISSYKADNNYIYAPYQALRRDLMYEFYWYGRSYRIYFSSANTSVTYSFNVAHNYSASGASDTYETNRTTCSATTKAVTNAKAIAQKAAGMDLYDALKYFKEQICDLTSYNYDAYHSDFATYGSNAWAIVYVFDGDDSTKVVCEGYARAFKYLCDEWGIQSHNADCYIVTGRKFSTSTGSGGGHMWNIVQTPSGNYLVDVTVCDGGDKTGGNNICFLQAPTSIATMTYNGEDRMYEYTFNSGKIKYDLNTIYSDGSTKLDDLDKYTKSEIDLSENSYIDDQCLLQKYNGWKTIDGQDYWYEKGVKQGTTGRGKEIYDPSSDAWYWLDSDNGGAKAVSKDVYQESNGGKWVRYDVNGHMIKGWNTNKKGTYYFDLITGAMQKGKVTINGLPCWFDETTGIGKDLVWEQVNGQDYYWYEGGKRQGYDPTNKAYRGKEIYDPRQGAWFWLDNNAKGKKAVSKDVYQPYTYQGKDNIGKWVRYNETGRMVKGWQQTSIGWYYFDKTTGAMTKGLRNINGRDYYFDPVTGIWNGK